MKVSSATEEAKRGVLCMITGPLRFPFSVYDILVSGGHRLSLNLRVPQTFGRQYHDMRTVDL